MMKAERGRLTAWEGKVDENVRVQAVVMLNVCLSFVTALHE